ncbi:aminomethyl-transferring glycine dehydrogenase subunit GcvPA [Breznakiella homolactica]|uniref:Probable glycine dehydrogenase (decarboxylating) subunit 1 n=1 Tax=Breznakiella homolactica TaxID=2798577 RepID=A0A7T8BD70_9SPIR|nr:aminomethyl-transferring glycine dehydrogenase subunit GcvPA [Breznakiella homolactica]QQO10953.1 aminomethyl-transferring glycine dehydrogenase subunit GcvPA [Breznakiella homolactica]
MPYIPVTDSQREAMLRKLGIASSDALFSEIPGDLRFPELAIGEGLSETEVLREIASLAELNADADGFRWFLGGGAYDHFVPAAVGALSSRGEFVTAYTPYQPEVSQGTLQAIFEYQSMVAELTGMEVVNASHYDGATALAEAILMALRNTEGRNRILIPEGIHPEYRTVLDTYLAAFDVTVETYRSSPAEAARAVQGDDLAALISCYPDFFGTLPELKGAAEAVHEKGGIFIVHADPVMLGLFRSPGSWGADVVTAEGQSLGNDINYGGPFLGIMATTNALMRRMPGRIVGETVDVEGKRGFVLTLVAREQHIRREKAVSNICSNQGLSTLRACIYLALMGKQGLRKTAELCWHRAHYCAAEIAKLPGFSVAPGTFFKEFTVTLPCDAEALAEKLCDKRIVPGLPLSRYFPDRKNELLICVTEKNSRADIDELVAALREASR